MPDRQTAAVLAEKVRSIEEKVSKMPELTESEREAIHDMARVWLGVRALKGPAMFFGAVLGFCGSVLMNWQKIKAAVIGLLT